MQYLAANVKGVARAPDGGVSRAAMLLSALYATIGFASEFYSRPRGRRALKNAGWTSGPSGGRIPRAASDERDDARQASRRVGFHEVSALIYGLRGAAIGLDQPPIAWGL
jgi:hypothetical protein